MHIDKRPVTVFATHPTPKGVVAVGFFDDTGEPFERPWTALRGESIRSCDDLGPSKTTDDQWSEWVRRLDVTGYVYLFRKRKHGRETQTVMRNSDNLYRWSWYGGASYMSGHNLSDLDSARADCEAYTVGVEGATAPTEVK